MTEFDYEARIAFCRNYTEEEKQAYLDYVNNYLANPHIKSIYFTYHKPKGTNNEICQCKA